MYEENPSAWIRPIQITVTRLLHVTMTTLHQHLGLGEELLRRRVDDRQGVGDPTQEFRNRNASGHSMKVVGKFRPRHRRLSSSDERGEQLSKAIQLFIEALKLPVSGAQGLLQSRIELVQLEEGQTVVEQGSEAPASLFVCLNGALKLSQVSCSLSKEGHLFKREILGKSL